MYKNIVKSMAVIGVLATVSYANTVDLNWKYNSQNNDMMYDSTNIIGYGANSVIVKDGSYIKFLSKDGVLAPDANISAYATPEVLCSVEVGNYFNNTQVIPNSGMILTAPSVTGKMTLIDESCTPIKEFDNNVSLLVDGNSTDNNNTAGFDVNSLSDALYVLEKFVDGDTNGTNLAKYSFDGTKIYETPMDSNNTNLVFGTNTLYMPVTDANISQPRIKAIDLTNGNLKWELPLVVATDTNETNETNVSSVCISNIISDFKSNNLIVSYGSANYSYYGGCSSDGNKTISVKDLGTDYAVNFEKDSLELFSSSKVVDDKIITYRNNWDTNNASLKIIDANSGDFVCQTNDRSINNLTSFTDGTIVYSYEKDDASYSRVVKSISPEVGSEYGKCKVNFELDNSSSSNLLTQVGYNTFANVTSSYNGNGYKIDMNEYDTNSGELKSNYFMFSQYYPQVTQISDNRFVVYANKELRVIDSKGAVLENLSLNLDSLSFASFDKTANTLYMKAGYPDYSVYSMKLTSITSDGNLTTPPSVGDDSQAYQDGINYVLNNLSEFSLVPAGALETFTKSDIDGLSGGWSLVGSSEPITDLSIFDGASIVWSYDNGSWSAYSPNSSVSQAISSDASIGGINGISSKQGFWILK